MRANSFKEAKRRTMIFDFQQEMNVAHRQVATQTGQSNFLFKTRLCLNGRSIKTLVPTP